MRTIRMLGTIILTFRADEIMRCHTYAPRYVTSHFFVRRLVIVLSHRVEIRGLNKIILSVSECECARKEELLRTTSQSAGCEICRYC